MKIPPTLSGMLLPAIVSISSAILIGGAVAAAEGEAPPGVSLLESNTRYQAEGRAPFDLEAATDTAPPNIDTKLSFNKSSQPRRRLNPDTSIIQAIQQELANGVKHPRFTITAHFQKEDQTLFPWEEQAENHVSEAEPFEVDVVLTNPSVDDATYYSMDGGPNVPVNDPPKFLIAEHGFAILTIDEDHGTVKGVVQKDSKLVSLVQDKGGEVIVAETNYDPPKDWTCTVLDAESEQPDVHLVDGHGLEHGHNHNPFADLTEAIGLDLNGQDIQNRRRLYATDDFPLAYSYQADLFIEVDTALVAQHDPLNQTAMPNTINYVNALITAVSSIFEREVDTHLHVLHIAKTDRYDNAVSTTNALDIMVAAHQSLTWHYQDPNTQEVPDIHHGIFHKSLQGGIAYVGQVCSSYGGYGLSSGVQGSMDDINAGEMYWDIYVIAHEIGHSFGSGHSHDSDDYQPLVDQCGIIDQSGYPSCYSIVSGKESQYVSEGDATIMSYCHLCTGGVSNVALTFGGSWSEGLRSDVETWENTDAIEWSQNPKRIPKTMYDHISSRGTCVEPYLSVPIQNCVNDADCHDGNACTIDTCGDIGSCNPPTLIESCCGNHICEAYESVCSDCGPFILNGGKCTYCYNTMDNYMFDIEALGNVLISGISFRVYDGTGDVTVYTAPGSFSDKYWIPSAWQQIYSNSYSSAESWGTIDVQFDEKIRLVAGSSMAFYIYAEGNFVSGESPIDTQTNPLASDDNLKVLNSKGGTGVPFGGTFYSNILTFERGMQYSLIVPCDNDADCDDGDSCTDDICENGLCSNTMSDCSSSPSTSPSSSPSTFLSSTSTNLPSTSPSQVTMKPSDSPSTTSSNTPSSSATSNYPSISPSSTSKPTEPSSYRPTELEFPSMSPSQATMKPSDSPSTASSDTPSSSATSNYPSISPHPTNKPTEPSSYRPTELEFPSTSPSSDPSAPPLSSSVPCLPIASKIKLQSITGIPIQMFELEVYSSGTTNVALGKAARQSSTYRGRAKFAASKAIDGNNSTTFCHTGQGDKCAWWEVNLNGMYPIEYIKIVNRWCVDETDPNLCLCRLSYTAVSLLDSQGKWVNAVLTGNTCVVKEWVHAFTPSSDYCPL